MLQYSTKTTAVAIRGVRRRARKPRVQAPSGLTSATCPLKCKLPRSNKPAPQILVRFGSISQVHDHLDVLSSNTPVRGLSANRKLAHEPLRRGEIARVQSPAAGSASLRYHRGSKAALLDQWFRLNLPRRKNRVCDCIVSGTDVASGFTNAFLRGKKRLEQGGFSQ
jgi:hypothetical protein